jgi:hypothetical protein
MKNLTTVLFWSFAIIAAILTFAFFWKKQQNEQDIKILETVLTHKTQNQACNTQTIEIEQKSLIEKIKEGIKSLFAFCLGILIKM